MSERKEKDKQETKRSLTDHLIFGGGFESTFDKHDKKEQNSAHTGTRAAVHVRMQQRNGRKCLTTIEGLANDLDLKKILRYLKKTFSTNGTILKDPTMGKVLLLQGDQRDNVQLFLTKTHICEKDLIKVHGH